MHLRQMPYDRATPPPPRRPQRLDGDAYALVCWAIVMICIIIGAAT